MTNDLLSIDLQLKLRTTYQNIDWVNNNNNNGNGGYDDEGDEDKTEGM